MITETIYFFEIAPHAYAGIISYVSNDQAGVSPFVSASRDVYGSSGPFIIGSSHC